MHRTNANPPEFGTGTALTPYPASTSAPSGTTFQHLQTRPFSAECGIDPLHTCRHDLRSPLRLRNICLLEGVGPCSKSSETCAGHASGIEGTKPDLTFEVLDIIYNTNTTRLKIRYPACPYCFLLLSILNPRVGAMTIQHCQTGLAFLLIHS
jgi:hypothetical protein